MSLKYSWNCIESTQMTLIWRICAGKAQSLNCYLFNYHGIKICIYPYHLRTKTLLGQPPSSLTSPNRTKEQKPRGSRCGCSVRRE
jgi:hypothetical protein